MPVTLRTVASAHLAVLDVIGQGVDHGSRTPFGPKQVQLIQSLQSCLEDTCDPQYDE